MNRRTGTSGWGEVDGFGGTTASKTDRAPTPRRIIIIMEPRLRGRNTKEPGQPASESLLSRGIRHFYLRRWAPGADDEL